MENQEEMNRAPQMKLPLCLNAHSMVLVSVRRNGTKLCRNYRLLSYPGGKDEVA